MEVKDLFDQDETVIEAYTEKAIEKLIDMAHLPLSDDVWATDKYDEIISQKAQEMYENDTN